MKKVVSIAAAGLLAVALSAPAWADCGVQHTADSSKSGTTMTPKPKSGG